jgi:hypothetical protein
MAIIGEHGDMLLPESLSARKQLYKILTYLFDFRIKVTELKCILHKC